MVIGNGMMAQKFLSLSHNENLLIFASGVSNSKETDIKQFEREKKKLIEAINIDKSKKFIYFSTCSIYDDSENESLYVKHKLACEKIIEAECEDYLICRISNVVGKTKNENTIISFLVSKIANDKPFQLWKNSVRNIIDIDDVLTFFTQKLNSSNNKGICIIANPYQYTVVEIVNYISLFLGKKANFEIVDKGTYFNIPLKKEDRLILEKQKDFNIDTYLKRILTKYY